MEVSIEMDRQYPILVVCALIIADGKVLLERHAPADAGTGYLWDIPGGKVEIGETPEQAVVREIREEMGVEIAVQKMLPRLDVSSWGNRHWVLATYRCRIVSGEAVVSEDLAWHDLMYLNPAIVKAPDMEIIRSWTGVTGIGRRRS
jgi:8-oxo-dGTP diphosphatase